MKRVCYASDTENDTLQRQLFSVLLSYASVDVTGASGCSNNIILRLSVTCKWLKELVESKYHLVKVFYTSTGTEKYDGANMGTQWLYISRAYVYWTYHIGHPYMKHDIAANYTFVCDNRVVATFYHVSGHTCCSSIDKHKSGIPHFLETNWPEYSNGTAKELVFTFSKE